MLMAARRPGTRLCWCVGVVLTSEAPMNATQISPTEATPSPAAQLYRLHVCADLLLARGQYRYAEPLYRAALLLAERMFGADAPSTAALRNNLAVLYKYLGRFEEASAEFERAASLTENMRERELLKRRAAECTADRMAG